jgi:hypothetical protein
MKIEQQIRNPPLSYGPFGRHYDVLLHTEGEWNIKGIVVVVVRFIDDNRWWIVSDIPALNERISNPSFDTKEAAIAYLQLIKD